LIGKHFKEILLKETLDVVVMQEGTFSRGVGFESRGIVKRHPLFWIEYPIGLNPNVAI
jgi:hypothetical protein